MLGHLPPAAEDQPSTLRPVLVSRPALSDIERNGPVHFDDMCCVKALLLARLLLRDPSVVLLDEPTAAMDEGTERHFVQQFGAWSKGRTVVIATHRTRILDLVDRVMVVEGGQVARDMPKARFLAQVREPTVVKVKKAGQP